MKPTFETDYEFIINRVKSIDPIAYGKTRNYIDGSITYLSPYISRGVISTRQILKSVLDRGYEPDKIESFVKELAWRDYFQRVWQERNIDVDIKHQQQNVHHFEIPEPVLNGSTGIQGIDEAIATLYETGYMHNHCRMYTASLVCNVGQSHWKNPAHWMYYYLLDGDWASNSCSWQWVAGCNSGKKYFANQENISRFTRTRFQNSYLNKEYEELEKMKIPESLKLTNSFEGKTKLPDFEKFSPDPNLPTYIYNYYNLDPLWHADEKANRVLLLEPSVFEKYPVSKKCIDFTLALSSNIHEMQVFVGSFEELKSQNPTSEMHFKEHPLNSNYKGISEQRDWISPWIHGYFPSFFAYWKVLEKDLKKHPFID